MIGLFQRDPRLAMFLCKVEIIIGHILIVAMGVCIPVVLALARYQTVRRLGMYLFVTLGVLGVLQCGLAASHWRASFNTVIRQKGTG